MENNYPYYYHHHHGHNDDDDEHCWPSTTKRFISNINRLPLKKRIVMSVNFPPSSSSSHSQLSPSPWPPLLPISSLSNHYDFLNYEYHGHPSSSPTYSFDSGISSHHSSSTLSLLSSSSSPPSSPLILNEPLDLSFTNQSITSSVYVDDHELIPHKSSSSSSIRKMVNKIENIDNNKSKEEQHLICPSCNKIYESLSRYRAHIRRHESKQSGRYQCYVCQKNFVQRSSLRTHIRIHTGEKPYHCQICDQRFGDFSTFTKHRRTHTGEKPYQCPACMRSFSQSGNMHRHLKIVHKPRPNNLYNNKQKQSKTNEK